MNLIADYRTDEGIRIRKDGNSPTLTASHHSESEPSRMQGLIIEKKINVIGNLKGKDGHECHNVHDPNGIAPTVRQNHGKITMIKEPKTQIRRLSCLECEKLQGFPDGWTEGQSDTQRYKQLGNAVSVPVVKEIAKRLKPLCL